MKLRNKRKPVLFTLVICIVFLLLFSQVAFAADPVKLSASSASGEIGDQVTVTISIANAQNTTGGQFDLLFDSTKVKFISVARGVFVPMVSGNDFGHNLVADGKLRVLWLIPAGTGTVGEGAVCTVTFELLDDGKSTLDFTEVVIAPGGTAVATTHTKGEIETVDPAVAKQAAIDAACDAVMDLPTEIILADKAAVEAARALVVKAKTDHGAVDADFICLPRLVAAESAIAKLEAIKEACDAVADLPDVDKLTLDDKPDVVAARALINKVKTDHGAVDADFACLSKLVLAENKIKELEGLKPTPPTGGMSYILLAGGAILLIGLIGYLRRSKPALR
jgi:hypothetical protein